MRLDKFLSDNDHGAQFSRKQLKQLIRQGRVTVNGDIITQAQYTLDTDTDQVALDGRVLTAFIYRYFMLNKPQGIICDRDNSHYDDVFSLIDYQHPKYPLQVAGRLDQDTTGLVLLTNDGAWLHRASSGKLDKNKVYQVTLAHSLEPAAIEQLQSGILLRGEETPCLAKSLTMLSPNTLELVIDEGRYHQVKRMFGALANKVVKLHRSQVGAITLDKTLALGASRPLSLDEIHCI